MNITHILSSLAFARLHFFANFGMWVSQCDLQMCAMCVGSFFKRIGKNKISPSVSFLIICFISRFNIYNLRTQFLFSALRITVLVYLKFLPKAKIWANGVSQIYHVICCYLNVTKYEKRLSTVIVCSTPRTV